jgi:hypothetical protein
VLFCPTFSMAREASTLSLVTCLAGFFRRGIDPVGETINVPDTPLGSRRLCRFTASIREPERFHGCPKRRAQEAPQAQQAQQADQA